MSFDLKINQLPALTWNHLGMNEAVLKNVKIDGEGRFEATIPDGICVDAEKGCCAKEPEEVFSDNAIDHAASLSRHAAMETELNEQLETRKIPVHKLLVGTGEKIAQPARFHFSCQDGGHVFDRISITAQEDSELTVVMDFSSPAGASSAARAAESFAGIHTKFCAGKNALLRLVQIQRPGDGFTFFNDIDGLCEEGARFELIQLVFGGGSTFQGCTVQLAGRESSFGADIGYLVQGSQRLDMNYAAFHQGKQSKSEINAHGVLKDRAFKLFRGTIDFCSGTSGSEGEEKEDVLLLDDGVVNQTIPLILCAEEDVQGNHGATIGNLDEELLFYLESRGISKSEIYEMMARARLETVCQKISDGEARTLAQSCLNSALGQVREGGTHDEH